MRVGTRGRLWLECDSRRNSKEAEAGALLPFGMLPYRAKLSADQFMPDTLHLVLILLAAAVVVVVACRLVRLPPIVGYLAVGIALGPHALAWVPDDSDTH